MTKAQRVSSPLWGRGEREEVKAVTSEARLTRNGRHQRRGEREEVPALVKRQLKRGGPGAISRFQNHPPPNRTDVSVPAIIER